MSPQPRGYVKCRVPFEGVASSLPYFLVVLVLGTLTGCVGIGMQNPDLRVSADPGLPVPADSTQCATPSYPCARTDTSVIPLGTLPAWGRRTGANTVFTDSSFNSSFPPQYVR